MKTNDIFYAAFLSTKYNLIGVEDPTFGHRKIFVFDAEESNAYNDKKEYVNSEYYKVKNEIEKLKLMGE